MGQYSMQIWGVSGSVLDAIQQHWTRVCWLAWVRTYPAGLAQAILRNCEVAVSTSRALEEGVDPASHANQRGTPASRINFLESFWMATVGGAKSLGLKVGQFSEGYAFDAIVMDTTLPDSNLIVWSDSDTHEDVLQKIIYNASRRNISKVWIQGKVVKENQ